MTKEPFLVSKPIQRSQVFSTLKNYKNNSLKPIGD
jgi:hypothetical protein